MTRQPSPTVAIKWCDGCGADDRFQPLRERHRPHFQFQVGDRGAAQDALKGPGGYCTGTVRTVVYRDPQVTP